AKEHASSWLDEIVPSFTEVPSAIIEYNATVQQQLGVVKQNLKALQQNPNDSGAKQGISSAIATLSEDTAPCMKAIVDLGVWISRYSADVQPDTTSLSKL